MPSKALLPDNLTRISGLPNRLPSPLRLANADHNNNRPISISRRGSINLAYIRIAAKRQRTAALHDASRRIKRTNIRRSWSAAVLCRFLIKVPGLLVLLSSSKSVDAAETPARGEQLARQYCGSCHLFPEPNLLTKIEWTHHIMPSMAQWLGVEPPNYE